ncbi:UDP-glycosyltransferase 73c3 [Phtheirospermum japonicum]|uniref:UDP-glycosyltransferase 73c3 n=1 Tax=Phtheirospermum japonicum TaxID=374723 RepID=A0A830BKE3_9LAMI|nr:UDP-glycosyltransferase 73c3 [Phtheirospermum japonicum]GFP85549.1 UDP-glycosyltransferase 73c3 [Phtheirospermum japonicum]
MHMLGVSKGFEDIAASEAEYFMVPDFPDPIEITKASIKGAPSQTPYEWAKICEQIQMADAQAYGTVANTFEELEPEYMKQYEKSDRQKGVVHWTGFVVQRG